MFFLSPLLLPLLLDLLKKDRLLPVPLLRIF